MFKIKWDKKNNLILLSDFKTDEEFINSPRPVYYEELDILEMDKIISYPKAEEPLLWAIGRKYFYKGEEIFETRGGNLFDRPEIRIKKRIDNLKLEPINIELFLKKNIDKIKILENEAIDFINDVYNEYKNQIKFFTVAFSGGKDSQVVLELVSQVIPPDDLVVIFSDTTMELPVTYDIVNYTKKVYSSKYPSLRFLISKPPKKAIEFWSDFGPPSMIQRWCCTVTKTAPFIKKIREIDKDFKYAIVFEGVRAEESEKRSNYSRVTKNIKSFKQINYEVILNWNKTEVFLYLFYRKIKINSGYRLGFHRVGCSLCPFGSKWYEFILNKKFSNFINDYLNIIYASNISLKKNDKEKFIKEGQWKKRAGGRELIFNDNKSIDIIYNNESIKGVLRNPEENFFEWLKVFGKVYYEKKSNNSIFAELKNKESLFNIRTKQTNDKLVIEIDKVDNIVLKQKFEKIFYKTTYCKNCGTCEAVCPFSAISFSPKLKIDDKKCKNCFKCLDFSEKGCLLAKSINISKGFNMSKKIATSKYQNFGLRKEWLEDFLIKKEDWFDNNELGNRQREAFLIWLKECSIIDKNKNITKTGHYFSNIFKKNKNLLWQLITINLYHGSNLFKWYFDKFRWGEILSSNELVSYILEEDSSVSEKTSKNSISSLLNLFDSTPIGNELKLGLVEKIKNKRHIKKIGTNNIHPFAVLYSLYYIKEETDKRFLTVKGLYNQNINGGPYKIFGIERDYLIKFLKGIEVQYSNYININIKSDLDNINLIEEYNLNNILEII